ncbi:hypothetical protein CFR77_05635 [Komagataeibacter sucrofermentans]|uniref:Transglycosylase SLT domain-containing protein n=2 Tax=Komagataeibacter sucrofermentans TaxID=1053551 RepID=A0A318QRR0_9PROT|nr:hypothetical protein CFR77_05635 [Komagataeibacter sucrofermentans]
MLMRGGLYGALAYGEYKLLAGQPFRTGGGRDTVVNTGPLQKDIYDAGSAAAQKYGLDPDHFLALLQTESGGYDRTSKAGAFGPSQLMPDTARSLGVADSVNAPNYDWRQNLDAGARYYKMQVDRFKGDYLAADAAYNAGPNSKAVQEYARTHIDAGLPSETQHYLASNAAIAAEMQRIRRTRDRLNATSGVATPPLFGGNAGDGGGNAPANVNVGISVHAPHGTKVQVTDAPPGTTVRPQIQTQRAMPPEITATGS